MLDNCCYNQIKILHDLSNIAWFLKECCQQDAQTCDHDTCKETIRMVAKDVNALIEKIHKSLK